jgi:hypothetical protein
VGLEAARGTRLSLSEQPADDLTDRLEPFESALGHSAKIRTFGLVSGCVALGVTSGLELADVRERLSRCATEPKERTQVQCVWIEEYPDDATARLLREAQLEIDVCSLRPTLGGFELDVPNNRSELQDKVVTGAVDLGLEDLDLG